MKLLTDYLDRKGIPYNEDMIKKFDAYRGGILQWNEFVNLTAIRDPEEFTVKHFIDSVACYDFPQYADAEEVVDMGTGAGFPGVPLAILSPEKKFVLIDSLNKRLKIIQDLCQNIGINNVVTIHGRAEDLGKDAKHREKYDLCVSRAVASLNVLCEYCLPFVKPGGSMIAYKGSDAEKEIVEAKKAIRILGGEIDDMVEVSISEKASEHKILIIKKIGKTPSKYPRKAGTPAKEPLK